MKRCILTSMFLLANILLAQDKQIKSFISQATGGNFSGFEQAKTELDTNLKLIKPEVLAEFYSSAVNKFAQEENTNTAIEYFGKLQNIEGKPYYYAKNKDNKQIEYFATEQAAKQATSQGNYAKIKSKTVEPKFGPELVRQMANIPQQLLAEANNQYNQKNYSAAAEKYQQVYTILKALGADDKLYLNNAAIAYQQAEQFKKSLEINKQLIKDGYTGATTTYSAMLTETGARQNFTSEQEMNDVKKLGLYSDFKIETTPSKEKEIYNSVLFNFIKLEQYKEALPYLDMALEKFPADPYINQNAGAIYFKSGNHQKYIQKLEENIARNPKDATSYFNLGTMYLDKPNATEQDQEKALQYLNKSIEVDPNNLDSYKNVTAILLKPEKEYVEKINSNLNRNDKNQRKIYNTYMAKRKSLYRKLLPYFEKMHQLDPNDYATAANLKNTYQVLEMFDKEDAIIPIVRELKKKRAANR